MNLDTIKKTLLLGESQNVEYLVDTPVSDVQMIGRDICAFLNSGGGYVVYGVGQDGEIKGVSIDSRRLINLEKALSGEITPKALVSFEKHEIEDKQLLVIEIPAGKDIPYAYQNEIFIRDGEQTIRADVEAIRNMVT
ncbi:MAG: ATP-binding protein, partial [Bacillota bacterium]|nr:ATP-binding protein [Bacillota bacterium]